MIKSAIVPGTDIPDLFRESIHYDQIKKYLDKLTITISSKVGVFAEDTEFNHNDPDLEVTWESPLKGRGLLKQPTIF